MDQRNNNGQTKDFTVYGVPVTLRSLAKGYDMIIPNDDTGRQIAQLFRIHHRGWIVQDEVIKGGGRAIRIYDPATASYDWSLSDAEIVYGEYICNFFQLQWVEVA